MSEIDISLTAYVTRKGLKKKKTGSEWMKALTVVSVVLSGNESNENQYHL